MQHAGQPGGGAGCQERRGGGWGGARGGGRGHGAVLSLATLQQQGREVLTGLHHPDTIKY